jgi:hypothetical protein
MAESIEIERDRMEGDFTRARVEKIWCFMKKPRGVCMRATPLVELPDEDALNPVFALFYSMVSLPLMILDKFNPHVSVQPVNDDLKTLNLQYNLLKKIPGSIKNLDGLEEVDLSANLFKRFPAAVTELPGLKVLRVSQNEVRNISPKLGGMGLLQELRCVAKCPYSGCLLVVIHGICPPGLTRIGSRNCPTKWGS